MQNILLEHKQYCTKQARLHTLAASHYNSRNRVLEVPQKLVLFFSSTLLAPYCNPTNDEKPSKVITLLATVFTLLSGTLSLMSGHFKYKERVYKHRSSSSVYSQLYREINHYMARSNTSSEDIDSFLTIVEHRLNDVDDGQPDIPHKLCDKQISAVDKSDGRFMARQASCGQHTQIEQHNTLELGIQPASNGQFTLQFGRNDDAKSPRGTF